MRAFPVFALPFAAALVLADDPPPVLPAPTGVVAYAPNQNRVHLSWNDTEGEVQYWIDRWDRIWEEGEEEGEGEWVEEWAAVGTLEADFEVFRALAPSPSSDKQVVKYRIAAVYDGGVSDWVEAEVLKPSGPLDLLFDPDGGEVPEGNEVRAGEVFAIPLEAYNGTPNRFFVRDEADLPPGTVLLNGVVSGKIETPGVYRFHYGVEFDDGEEPGGVARFEQIRFLRVLPAASAAPPVVASPGFFVPVQNVGVRGFVDLVDLFADPGGPRGVCFDTSLGGFTVALYDEATPKTVENFLGYVNRGDYDGSFVHRAAPGFVVQGGGARPYGSSVSPTMWGPVQKRAAVPNEPGISNRRGTIAMAKMGGSPDSATSEWFVSTGAGNPLILDGQNGGFTAFGEVVGTGMSVVDAIQARPKGDYRSVISGNSGVALEAVPVLDPGVAPAVPTAGSFVRVFSVRESPPLDISLVSNSRPAVVSAAVSGMSLFLDSKGGLGTANLLLRATDPDGNHVDFNLPVRIDDFNAPSFRLTSLRSVKPYGTVLARGRAKDDVGLGKWRYRINNKRWMNGGRLRGKSATMKAKMRGFKRGRNLIRIEVIDGRKNSSGILRMRVTFA